MTTKICTKCCIDKGLDQFHKSKASADGLVCVCKSCKSAIDASHRANNREKIAKVQKAYYQANSERIVLKTKTWVENNKERHAANNHNWYLQNQDKVKVSRAKHLENNREFMKEYFRTYMAKRYRENNDYRIKNLLNNRIRSCIHKADKTLKYLQSTMQFFKDWIQFQFQSDEKMTWDNMGSYWHFDHVKPCSAFDLSKDEDIFTCFKWSNLRPLSARENCVKHNAILPDVIEQQAILAEAFEKEYVAY